jgi:hypothetical protein
MGFAGLLFPPASRLALMAVDQAFLYGLSASLHRHPQKPVYFF